MPRYLIIHDIRKANGTETWTVEADSESAALALHKEGKTEFVSQDVEVTSLCEPEILLDREKE